MGTGNNGNDSVHTAGILETGTAVTRARRCVTIVGSEETFREMIKNEKQQRRYSSLDIRLKEEL